MPFPPCPCHEYVGADSNGEFLCIVVVIHLPPCPYLFTFYLSSKMSTHHWWSITPLPPDTLQCHSFSCWAANKYTQQADGECWVIVDFVRPTPCPILNTYYFSPKTSFPGHCALHSFPCLTANISLLCHCLSPPGVLNIKLKMLVFLMKLMYICTLTKCHSQYT